MFGFLAQRRFVAQLHVAELKVIRQRRRTHQQQSAFIEHQQQRLAQPQTLTTAFILGWLWKSPDSDSSEEHHESSSSSTRSALWSIASSVFISVARSRLLQWLDNPFQQGGDDN